MYQKWFRSGKKKAGRKSGEAAASGQHRGAGTRSGRVSRRQLFLIIGIVVVVVLGIFIPYYYQTYVAPFNRIVITIDNVQISVRYFLERARLAGADPLEMLQTLTNETVIELAAPQYGIQVTEADIDQELRSMAAGTDNVSVSEVEFKEWYRQTLNESKVNDAQYRELLYYSLLASRMQTYLADHTPTAMAQVHLHDIVVITYEDATKAVDRLKAGEDFATVAKDMSLDSSTKDNGGDAGWVPPVILGNYESAISALEVNQPSDPMAYYSSSSSSSYSSSAPSAYYIFMVSEKDDARPLDDTNLEIIKAQALSLWLPEEIARHDVKYNFTSEMYAWMNWQLQKDEPASSTNSTG
jgi:parvulin-like peptidyl-prolyl isomerase